MNRLLKTLSSPKAYKLKYLLGLFVITAIISSLHKFFRGEKELRGGIYTHYNNFVIDRQSFIHLLQNENLYLYYPNEYADVFKYSPTYAIFMGPLYYLPDLLGAVVYNLLNAIILFIGIKSLPRITDKTKIYILLLIVLELTTSLQNFQTNALITGLLLLSFTAFEKENLIWASFFIVSTIYIKVFGVVASLLFILYPHKLRFLLYFLAWSAFLFILPMAFVKPAELIAQYENWWELLSMDYSRSYGISVFGILNSWFGVEPSKLSVVIAGILIFCVPFIRTDLYKDFVFRLLFMCSILIWVIIFNHKAESPTFIIALTGCSIWFFIQERSILRICLIVLAFLFIALSPTDIFPKYLKEEFVKPYRLKALPAVLIWFTVIYELVFNKYSKKAGLTSNST